MRDKPRFPMFITVMGERNGDRSTTANTVMLALLAGVGVLSYFITTLTISQVTEKPQAPEQNVNPNAYPYREQVPKTKRTDREAGGLTDMAAIDDGAIPNQRVIVFKDKSALDAFLKRTGGGISTLGRLDSMNALLVGFGNLSDLEGLLDGTEETAFNFPASIPDFESVGPQDGAVSLGSELLKWLGIEGDNSLWGKGLRIAVLDTGIADHLVFKNAIERINIVPLSGNPADLNGHGTAVASLIFSDNPFAPGVAPGATPISIRVADDNGSSSSFQIVQGIEAAIGAGADYINVSLGGQGKSTLLDRMIQDAVDQGIVIVASAGNTGREGVLQPAANPNVIALGSVDGINQPMAFSTTGSEVAAAAPGFGINAAYPNGQAAQVSGTSFSAPIALASMAGIASNNGSPTMTPRQSADRFLSNLHDIGTQGADTSTGSGVPNLGTILNPRQFDASVNSINVTSGKNGSQAQVLVQNVGTRSLVNTAVTVNVNGVPTTANLTTLAPMESRVINVAVPSTGSLNIQGSVRISGGQSDQRPSNDSLSQKITPDP